MFEPPYKFALSKHRIAKHFPNLEEGVNFFFTSEKDEDYNCAAWAAAIDDEWIQFKDQFGNTDSRIHRYIEYYKTLGFRVITDPNFEQETEKIVLYTDPNGLIFKHAARQLNHHWWTSKIGDWEDIKHLGLESVASADYGIPFIIMAKQK